MDIREILFCYDLERRTHRSVERASQGLHPAGVKRPSTDPSLGRCEQRPQRVHGATHLHSVLASCWGRRLIFHCSAKVKMSVCNNFDDGGAQHPKRHTQDACVPTPKKAHTLHRMHSANQPRDAQNRVDTVSWPGICSLLCFKYHARPERHS